MNWIITRFSEASTWRGIVLLLTVCGAKLEPDQQEAIVLAGLAIVGLLGAFTKDGSKQVTVEPPSIKMQSDNTDDGYVNRDALTAQNKRQTGFNDQ